MLKRINQHYDFYRWEPKTEENKMGLKEKLDKNKGITLIALVVTIIVLLILARNINKYDNRTKWNIK